MSSKIQVVLLYGGCSVEHHVSIMSARNIAEYIDRNVFDLLPIGITQDGGWFKTSDVQTKIDRREPLLLTLNRTESGFVNHHGHVYKPHIVFSLLHGTYGEDGSIQGLLKTVDIPFVGSSVLGSAISMNKLVSKQLLEHAGIDVVPYLWQTSSSTPHSFEDIVNTLGLPFMIKSNRLGSSIGVSKVNTKTDFQNALHNSQQYDTCVLFEKYIEGREIECAVMGNIKPKATAPGEIIINKKYDFYTFDAKYIDADAVKIEVPAQLEEEIKQKIQHISQRSFEYLGCDDYARVDLFLDKAGKIYVNEINTIPGFTNISMFPKMWMKFDVSFSQLISELIFMALDRKNRSSQLSHHYQGSIK